MKQVYQKTTFITSYNNEPFISVVICTGKVREVIEKYALTSLATLDYANFEVVVVVDTVWEEIEETKRRFEKITSKDVRVVMIKKRRGLCHARNIGVQESQGEIIAFIDDDCVAEQGWLKELVKPYLGNSETACVGGIIYDGESDRVLGNSSEVFGGNMSFERKIFDLFLFDKKIYFNRSSFHDETDLINRLKKHNYQVILAKEAVVKHFPSSANYRHLSAVGAPLNWIYIHTKELSFYKYYWALFLNGVFILMKKSRDSISPRTVTDGLSDLGTAIFSQPGQRKKIFWVLWVLVVKLYPMAKRIHWLEERKFFLGKE